MLTGPQILENLNKNIFIEPFEPLQLNPNSYNVRLADTLLVYDNDILDMKEKNPYHLIKIPEEGLVIQPGKLYLGRTLERTETNNFVPMLEGRSSVGRLGVSIHATAGFGDIGFCGYWTLEISCIQPARIYPGVEIGQLYYEEVTDAEQVLGLPENKNRLLRCWRRFTFVLSKMRDAINVTRTNSNTYNRLTYKNGKYQNNVDVQPSMMWMDFEKKKKKGT